MSIPFNTPLFTYCYLNENFGYASVCFMIHKENYHHIMQESLILMKKYNLEVTELKIMEKNGFNPTIIEKGYATIDECKKFGVKLFDAYRLATQAPCSSILRFSYTRPYVRVLIEFNCEGLGRTDPDRYRHSAIVSLMKYLELKRGEYMTERHTSSYEVTSFFKKSFDIDSESKILAAESLILVLLGERFFLPKIHMNVLTKGLGTLWEDRLTNIVRTMVIEPFELNSLEELYTNLEVNNRSVINNSI